MNDKNKALKLLKFLLLIILLIDFAISAKYKLNFRRVSFASALVLGFIYFLIRKTNYINADDILNDTLDEWTEKDMKNRGRDDFFNNKFLGLMIVIMFLAYLISSIFGITFRKLAMILIIITSLIYGIIYLLR